MVTDAGTQAELAAIDASVAIAFIGEHGPSEWLRFLEEQGVSLAGLGLVAWGSLGNDNAPFFRGLESRPIVGFVKIHGHVVPIHRSY